jgi:hypothetical protein
MVAVRQVLHRLLWTAPKHEFWLEWSGPGALVAKNSDATSSSELVRSCHQFGQFCTDFHAVTKQSETPENISFGSNGVDRVRSLRQILKQLCLANLCVNGTSSARLAPTFVQY